MSESGRYLLNEVTAPPPPSTAACRRRLPVYGVPTVPDVPKPSQYKSVSPTLCVSSRQTNKVRVITYACETKLFSLSVENNPKVLLFHCFGNFSAYRVETSQLF